MMVIGFVFVYDGYNSASGKACTVLCTTTSTTSTGPSPFSLTVRAVNQNGNPLAVQFYIDAASTQVSTTPQTIITLPTGMHTITCLPLTGYNIVTGQVGVNSQPSSSSTVTCTYSSASTFLVVTTTDVNGNQLQGTITVDGTSIGTGSATETLLAGRHTLSCGPVTGYTAPLARTLTLAPGTYNTACVYALANGAQTTTLTVSLELCPSSIPCTNWQGIAQQSIQLSSGQAAVTDSYGNAVFTVPVNANYIVNVSTLYGQAQQTVTVGGTPSSVTIQQCCSGAYQSIVGLSIFGSGTASIASELIVGIILLLIGGTGFVLSRSRKAGL